MNLMMANNYYFKVYLNFVGVFNCPQTMIQDGMIKTIHNQK